MGEQADAVRATADRVKKVAEGVDEAVDIAYQRIKFRARVWLWACTLPVWILIMLITHPEDHGWLSYANAVVSLFVLAFGPGLIAKPIRPKTLNQLMQEEVDG
jgi:hypothetical protein